IRAPERLGQRDEGEHVIATRVDERAAMLLFDDIPSGVREACERLRESAVRVCGAEVANRAAHTIAVGDKADDVGVRLGQLAEERPNVLAAPCLRVTLEPLLVKDRAPAAREQDAAVEGERLDAREISASDT